MSSSEMRASRVRQFATIVLGFLLAVIPLPEPVRVVRPDLLLLFVIYWSLTAPRISGLTLAWFCGVIMDVHQGTVLGQHAMGFLLVAVITHYRQLRMRVMTVLNQALNVLVLLAVYRFFIYWIDGITSESLVKQTAAGSWSRWLPIFSGALLWPVVVTIMDTWNRRRS